MWIQALFLSLVLASSLSFAGMPLPPLAKGPQGQVLHPPYGPWNNDLIMYESKDGITFTRKGIFEERGGVPNLVKDAQGRLFTYFQWFPLAKKESFDRIAVKMSQDQGKTWTKPQTISIQNFPSTLNRSFDPTAVATNDGKIRLYFASERGAARGMRGDRAIFSAISADGISFTFERGERFGFPDKETFDPTVIQHQGLWHLYCPIMGEGGYGYHATSRDGLNFENQPFVYAQHRGQWLGNVVALKEGGLRFYGSGPPGGIWTSFSSNGNQWSVAEFVGLEGEAADPAVIQTTAGRFLMIVTGPLRSDATQERPLW